jgi:hypothetical protein
MLMDSWISFTSEILGSLFFLACLLLLGILLMKKTHNCKSCRFRNVCTSRGVSGGCRHYEKE